MYQSILRYCKRNYKKIISFFLITLLILPPGFAQMVQFEETKEDLIDIILDNGLLEISEEEFGKYDINQDGKIDVADIISLIHKRDSINDALAAVMWAEQAGSTTNAKSVRPLEMEEISDFVGENPNAVDELAVYLTTKKLLGYESVGEKDIDTLLQTIQASWSENWNDNYKQTIATLANGGVDTDGDGIISGVADVDSLDAQVLAYNEINPSAFASVMTNKFGASPYLPENVFLNQYLQGLQEHLILKLSERTSWFEAWLMACADDDLGSQTAEELRRRVLATLLRQHFMNLKVLSQSGVSLVNELTDEQGPTANQIIPDKAYYVSATVDEVTPYTHAWNPREELVPIAGTQYFSATKTETLITDLSLTDPQASRLIRDQMHQRMKQEGVDEFLILAEAAPVNGNQRVVVGDMLDVGAKLGVMNEEYGDLVDFLEDFYDTNSIPDVNDTILASPENDLVIQVILEAFKFIAITDKTQFFVQSYDNPVDPNLHNAAKGIAALYVKLYGKAYQNNINPNQDMSLPGIDDLYYRNTQSQPSAGWDAWRAQFNEYRGTSDIYQLLTGDPVGDTIQQVSVVNTNGSTIFSNSRFNDEQIELHPAMVRLLKLTMALYLYEEAALAHKSSLYQQRKPSPTGIPQNDPLFDVVNKYIVALKLLDEAVPRSKLYWGNEETLCLGPVLMLVDVVTQNLIQNLGNRIPYAAHGLDFWGMGDKPFSLVGVGELKRIANTTIGFLEKIEEEGDQAINDQIQQQILGEKVSQEESNAKAAYFDYEASNHALAAAKLRVDAANEEMNLQDIKIQIAGNKKQRAEFLKDAKEYYKLANDESVAAQQRKKELAQKQLLVVKNQFDILKTQVGDLIDNVKQMEDNIQSSEQAVENLLIEYNNRRKELFENAVCIRPFGGLEVDVSQLISNEDCHKIGGYRSVNNHNRPRRDCGDRGGIAGLVQKIDRDLGCAMGDFWNEYEDEILTVAKIVSVAYTGVDYVSIAVGAIKGVEGVSQGDYDKAFKNFAQAGASLMEIPAVRSEVKDVLKDSAVGELIQNYQTFEGKAQPLINLIKSGQYNNPKAIKDSLRSQFLTMAKDEFGITEENVDQFINNAVSETLAGPMRELGVSFAMKGDELQQFVEQELGITVDPSDQNLIANVSKQIRDNVIGKIEEDFPAVANGLKNRFDDAQIESFSDCVENRLMDFVVEQEEKLDGALNDLMGLKNNAILADGGLKKLSQLKNLPDHLKNQITRKFEIFIKKRLVEIEDKVSVNVAKAAEIAVKSIPPEFTDTIVKIREIMAEIQAYTDYLTDRENHAQTFTKIMDIYGTSRDDNKFEEERDKHIQMLRDEIEKIKEKLPIAKRELMDAENLLAVKQQELDQAEAEDYIAGKMLEAGKLTGQALESELQAAMIDTVIAQQEIDAANKYKDVLDVMRDHYQEIMKQKEMERDAAQMRQRAAESQRKIAKLNQERFEIMQSREAERKPSLFLRNRHKELVFDISRRAIFDYAKTHDHLHGTNFLSLVRNANPESAAQFSMVLDHLDLLLFERTLDQQFRPVGLEDARNFVSLTLTQEDIPRAITLNEMNLDSNLIPNGTFREDDWYVWQIEMYLDSGNGIFHPAKLPQVDNRDDVHITYQLLPPDLFPQEKVIKVPYQDSVERLVYKEVQFSTRKAYDPESEIGFKSDARGNPPRVRLIHLGDMWFPSKQNPKSIHDIAMAPVLYNPDHGYAIPDITVMHKLFTNFQYLISGLLPLEAGKINAEEESATGFFGANYPLFGTWWILIKKDFLYPEWELKIDFGGSGILNMTQESNYQNSFQTPIFNDDGSLKDPKSYTPIIVNDQN